MSRLSTLRAPVSGSRQASVSASNRLSLRVGGDSVMASQTLTYLPELHADNGAQRCRRQRTVNHRLEAGQQRRLEVAAQYRAQQLVQV